MVSRLRKFMVNYKAAIDTNLPICPMVIAYVDKEGGCPIKLLIMANGLWCKVLKSVADARGITAYVLPLEPIILKVEITVN